MTYFDDGKLRVENRISTQIIGAAVELHRTLGGPGLLESVYEESLAWELESSGLKVERQKIALLGIKINCCRRHCG